MRARGVDGLIGANGRGSIVRRLHGDVVVQTAVISVDVPRTARLDMLQTIGRTHLMGEGIAKLLIAQEAIERVGGVADGKKLQEGGHGGPTLIAGRPLRHPRAAFSALALPAERQVGLKEEAAAKGTVLAAFAVVVERAALVIESLVALKEERRAVAEKYLVGETQTSLGLFFFFNGVVAVGLVKAYRLPRR